MPRDTDPALAAADPSAARQARLCAGQGLAAAAGAGRGDGQERGLCAAGQCRDARGLRLARQGDRRERAARRSSARPPSSRACPTPSCRRCSMRRATRTTARIAGEARELARAARGRSADGDAGRDRRPDRRACASSSTPSSPSISSAPKGARPREGLVSGLEAALQAGRDAMPATARCVPAARAAARPDLGDAQGRAGRPHRLGLADPPLHRSRPRASSSCRRAATSRSRASCASTCSRASSPTSATAAPSRCCWPTPASPIRRSSAIGEIIHDIDLKDDKYGREETAGVRSLIAGIAALEHRRRAAAGARRRAARRPLQLVRAARQGSK